MHTAVIMLLQSRFLLEAQIRINPHIISLRPRSFRPKNQPNLLELLLLLKLQMEKLRRVRLIKHKFHLLVRFQMFEIAPIRVQVVFDAIADDDEQGVEGVRLE